MAVFPNSEYMERLIKTKERMAQEGIDVLLVTDPANMNYLSGYDAWSFYVHQLLIIFIDEDQPYWIGRGQDRNAALHTTWLDQEHLYAYSDDYVQSEVKHPMDYVSDFIKAKKRDKATIGAEFDAYYFSAKNYIQLTKNLPNATLDRKSTRLNSSH